jgi:site-specific DNA recombinase
MIYAMEPLRKKKHQLDRLSYGYSRVSTTKQGDAGGSIEAQATMVQAMAVVKGVVLAEVITDVESAKNTDRTGLQRLLALCAAGRVQTVIISKLDRLTRSVRDLADLLELFDKHGVTLVSVSESLDTGSAAGKLVLNIMTAVSQWEREAIGERTATVLQHKRANLRVYSRLVPYGYQRVGDQLVADAGEQVVISRIQTQRHVSKLTLQAICDGLNRDGLRTKQGKSWVPARIADVLNNPLHRTLAVSA